MRIHVLLAGLPLFVFAITTHPAHGAESYDNCTGFIDSLPAVVSTQGVWCLCKDLASSIASSSAITIAANNVTVDCNDFKVGGLGAGIETEADGIHAVGRHNVVVRRCNIRGFRRGIRLEGGSGHVVESNRIESSTYAGISVDADGSVLRGNIVSDTGGAPGADQATGIEVGGAADVIDNLVSGVVPIDGTAAGDANGIATTNMSGSISANRVRGLAPTGAGIATGIRNEDNGPVSLRNNDIIGPGGAAGGPGLSCASGPAVARDNIVLGFDPGISGCTDSGNDLSP